MHSRMPGLFLAASFLALGACADTDETAVDDVDAGLEAPAEPVAGAASAAADVDTTAQAVWAYLQDNDYTNWELWPGTTELYEGGEPHGMLLTTYVNDVASDALASGATTFPDGAFVVKENYMPDGTLAAVTTMYKAGNAYNPDHADWWFAKFLPDGTPDQTPDGMPMAGRLGGCQSCHGGAADNDYILTSPLPIAAGGEGAGEGAGG